MLQNLGISLEMIIGRMNHVYRKTIRTYLKLINLIYRYIAAGLIVLGLGSFLFSLPHFLSDPLDGDVKNDIITTTCLINNGTDNPMIQQTSKAVSNYFLVFIFGQILHGIGAAPILSLGKCL